MTQTRFLAAALVAGALATAGAAYPGEDDASARTAPAVTITQAVATAEQHANGRAVEAELERGAQDPYYEVKVVGSNGVQKVYVDATDGKVIASKEKNRLTSWLDSDDDDDHDD